MLYVRKNWLDDRFFRRLERGRREKGRVEEEDGRVGRLGSLVALAGSIAGRVVSLALLGLAAKYGMDNEMLAGGWVERRLGEGVEEGEEEF